ncbi:MAG: UPF0276 protein [Candidatus Binatia bacterium]|nr:MAG: UPF0276 protein [Candidatus Binatia bacterium]
MERPCLGTGIGLRVPHYGQVLEEWPAVDWFEIVTENFLVPGGRPLHVLERVREHYPVVFHGVSLSIGSADPLDFGYLAALRELVRRFEPEWVSDHLCWTSFGGHSLHDLLPLPFTEEALDHVVERVGIVQDYLGRRILLENVSSYLRFRHSALPEWEFLAEVARRADCLVLLDVNNVYVSARNHGFDPETYLLAIPPERVWQFHLAGHSDKGTHLLDTHDHPVADPVWELYARAVRLFGRVSTLLERDDRIPELSELLDEARRAELIQDAELERSRSRDDAANPLVLDSRA